MTAITLLIAALLAALVALRYWMASPTRVLAEVDALDDIPAYVKTALVDCIYAARDADRKTWVYDLSAPLVMLVVLPWIKRSADKLPKLFRNWDNDVSMNGDGWGWQDSDGTWYDTRITPAPEGALLVRHSDPAYGGDCYYAKGHHPRSFWARYQWLGWRNRASLMSLELGEQIDTPVVCISGTPTVPRNTERGHFVLQSGDVYQYRSVRRVGSFALLRNYGFKLDNARYRTDRKAAAVAIGRSLKRRGD